MSVLSKHDIFYYVIYTNLFLYQETIKRAVISNYLITTFTANIRILSKILPNPFPIVYNKGNYFTDIITLNGL